MLWYQFACVFLYSYNDLLLQVQFVREQRNKRVNLCEVKFTGALEYNVIQAHTTLKTISVQPTIYNNTCNNNNNNKHNNNDNNNN